MRRFSYGLVIGFFWLGVNPSDGQTPKTPKQVVNPPDKVVLQLRDPHAAQPQTLEQMIAEALKNNPDLKVAESKVREAFAERERTRLHVTSEVARAQAEIGLARASKAEAKQRLDRAQILFDKGALPKEEVAMAILTEMKLAADLKTKELELAILGVTTAGDKKGKNAHANHPDLLVADTKVASAEAELNRTRTKVAMEVATLDAEIQSARAGFDAAQRQWERLKRLYETKALSREDYDAGLAAVEKAKAALSVKQAMLPYLLGKQPLERTLSGGDMLRIWLDVGSPTGTAPDGKRYKPLFMPATIDLDGAIQAEHALWVLTNIKSETPLTEKLREALDDPAAHIGGKFIPTDVLINVQTNMFRGINLLVRAKSLKKEPMEIKLTEAVPAGAFLQYLEDELDIVFILRDYGIVVVGADEKLPPGALRVIDFWKLGKAPVPAKSIDKK